MTAAQIRDAARLVGADATAENVLDRTDQVADIWLEGFKAGLQAVRDQLVPGTPPAVIQIVDGLMTEATWTDVG